MTHHQYLHLTHQITQLNNDLRWDAGTILVLMAVFTMILLGACRRG
jgi:hypothetical protein